MNKKALTIAIIVILAIGGGLIYLLTTSDAEQAKDEMVQQSTSDTFTTSSEPSTSALDPQPVQTAVPGKYVDYTSTVIAQTEGNKLLFFHAPWCPQCRALESDIRAKGVPDGVTIIKVDYDSNQALRQKYGVTLQTTVVRVSDSGELVEKFVAYDEPTLAAVVENLL